MYPEADGFRVYARRAFGDRAGFIVGWIDWLAAVATLAYAAVSAVEFVGTLWPPVAQYEAVAAIALLGAFTAMHSAGLRIGSTVTSVVSATIGILLLVLIVACFLTPARQPAGPAAPGSPGHVLSVGGALALVPALRALLTAYDGWYAPIYTAEESVDASRTLPRAIIGGALLVACLYLATNLALLRVPAGSGTRCIEAACSSRGAGRASPRQCRTDDGTIHFYHDEPHQQPGNRWTSRAVFDGA
jgi:APA family basic amino acid/polyamine antiporter